MVKHHNIEILIRLLIPNSILHFQPSKIEPVRANFRLVDRYLPCIAFCKWHIVWKSPCRICNWLQCSKLLWIHHRRFDIEFFDSGAFLHSFVWIVYHAQVSADRRSVTALVSGPNRVRCLSRLTWEWPWENNPRSRWIMITNKNISAHFDFGF